MCLDSSLLEHILCHPQKLFLSLHTQLPKTCAQQHQNTTSPGCHKYLDLNFLNNSHILTVNGIEIK